jgi:hypothetical protein
MPSDQINPQAEAVQTNQAFLQHDQTAFANHLHVMESATPDDKNQFVKALHGMTQYQSDGKTEEKAVLDKIGLKGATIKDDGSIEFASPANSSDKPLDAMLKVLSDVNRPLSNDDWQHLEDLLQTPGLGKPLDPSQVPSDADIKVLGAAMQARENKDLESARGFSEATNLGDLWSRYNNEKNGIVTR